MVELSLEQYREQLAIQREVGADLERERIIALLESDPKEMLYWGGGLRAGYETAIALIKGEN